jgi:hypothetical protein
MTRKDGRLEPEALTDDELDEANGEPLPDRQAMTVMRVEPLPQPFLIEPVPWDAGPEDPSPAD